MSNYHVLAGDERGKHFKVIFHVPTPTTTNKAGVTITSCLVQDPEHTDGSLVPHIGSTESAALTAGTLYEHVYPFSTNPGHTAQQDQARLDSLYSASVSKIQSKLERKYAYWHYDRDVP